MIAAEGWKFYFIFALVISMIIHLSHAMCFYPFCEHRIVATGNQGKANIFDITNDCQWLRRNDWCGGKSGARVQGQSRTSGESTEINTIC